MQTAEHKDIAERRLHLLHRRRSLQLVWIPVSCCRLRRPEISARRRLARSPGRCRAVKAPRLLSRQSNLHELLFPHCRHGGGSARAAAGESGSSCVAAGQPLQDPSSGRGTNTADHLSRSNKAKCSESRSRVWLAWTAASIPQVSET